MAESVDCHGLIRAIGIVSECCPDTMDKLTDQTWKMICAINGKLAQEAAASALLLEEEDRNPQAEAWNGDRKVTVYHDTVLCVWGTDIDEEMCESPKTLESVNDAFKWLYHQGDLPFVPS